MIVIDNYLGEYAFDMVLQILSGPHWEYPPFSTPQSGTKVWRIFKPVIESRVGFILYENIPKDLGPLRVKRVGINGMLPGTDSHLHQDGPVGHTSLIHFTSASWSPSWGGELQVGQDVIEYKPNRAVIFDSSIWHCPNTPTESNQLRVSVGLHMEPADRWEFKHIPRQPAPVAS
jgi:hypothetical protein